MSEKAVQDCHLKHASYHDIDPSLVKNKNTFPWISFVGDSVLREVFLSAGKVCLSSFDFAYIIVSTDPHNFDSSVQTLTNYIPKKDWFQSRHYPLLGSTI